MRLYSKTVNSSYPILFDIWDFGVFFCCLWTSYTYRIIMLSMFSVFMKPSVSINHFSYTLNLAWRGMTESFLFFFQHILGIITEYKYERYNDYLWQFLLDTALFYCFVCENWCFTHNWKKTLLVISHLMMIRMHDNRSCSLLPLFMRTMKHLTTSCSAEWNNAWYK